MEIDGGKSLKSYASSVIIQGAAEVIAYGTAVKFV